MRRIPELILAAALLGSPLHAQSESVLLVEADECPSAPTARAQTGFVAAGVNGIVTALHGVVGCRHLTARQMSGSIKPISGLRIISIDIERDMALLSRDGLALPVKGIGMSYFSPTTLSKASVLGHPSHMAGIHKMELEVGDPSLRRLGDLVPSELFAKLQTRGSPSVTVHVISINDDLQAGHSGAPILDANGRVIGVANGGLAGGTLGIGWAIPFQEIRWTSPDERELRDLGLKSPTLVFSVDSTKTFSGHLVRFRLEKALDTGARPPAFGPGGRPNPGASMRRLSASKLIAVVTRRGQAQRCVVRADVPCELRLAPGEHAVTLEVVQFQVDGREVDCDLSEMTSKDPETLLVDGDKKVVVSIGASHLPGTDPWYICDSNNLGAVMKSGPLL